MTPILVVPHGGRWAVKESPEATPIAEYETCELAELAAKQMAEERGVEVVVDRDAPNDFDGPDNVHPEGDESEGPVNPIDIRTGDTRGTEEPRVQQAGM
jgi:hypothetical protein